MPPDNAEIPDSDIDTDDDLMISIDNLYLDHKTVVMTK